MRRRLLQAGIDPVEMILRIRFNLRVPRKFFAVDHPAVFDSGDLVIARAQVESDTAAVEMPADRRAGLIFGRDRGGIRHDHFKGTLINAAHQVHIKLPPAGCRITRPDLITEVARAAEMDFPPAAGPQQKFYDAFDVTERFRVDTGLHNRFESRQPPPFPLETDD